MKNVIKIVKKSIIIITAFATIISNATEITSSVVKEEIIKTALTLNNVKEGNLLTIKDYNGFVLYKELINFSGTYRKGFDLSALPDGKYFFEVDKELEIKIIPFTVSNSKVVINKDKETTSYKPFVNQKDNLVFISKLSPNYEALKISIYINNKSEYELLHSEKIEGLQSIERVYKLEKGNYKIVFNSNNQEFTKFINN